MYRRVRKGLVLLHGVATSLVISTIARKCSSTSKQSEQIINGLVGVLCDQLPHALWEKLAQRSLLCEIVAYLWHYGFTILALHISEWHLGALMVVDLQVRVVHIRDILEWDWQNFSKMRPGPPSVSQRADDSLCCWITIRVTRTAVSVVICTGPRRLPGKPFTLNSEVRSGFI